MKERSMFGSWSIAAIEGYIVMMNDMISGSSKHDDQILHDGYVNKKQLAENELLLRSVHVSKEKINHSTEFQKETVAGEESSPGRES